MTGLSQGCLVPSFGSIDSWQGISPSLVSICETVYLTSRLFLNRHNYPAAEERQPILEFDWRMLESTRRRHEREVAQELFVQGADEMRQQAPAALDIFEVQRLHRRVHITQRDAQQRGWHARA